VIRIIYPLVSVPKIVPKRSSLPATAPSVSEEIVYLLIKQLV
jgi:hypothetical protein